GFAYSYMQSIGPSGVVVTGATTADAPAASWLVNTDGTRTRLASDCFNVTVSARVLAMRCASQLEIRDLATASSLYRFAVPAGARGEVPEAPRHHRQLKRSGDALLVGPAFTREPVQPFEERFRTLGRPKLEDHLRLAVARVPEQVRLAARERRRLPGPKNTL